MIKGNTKQAIASIETVALLALQSVYEREGSSPSWADSPAYAELNNVLNEQAKQVVNVISDQFVEIDGVPYIKAKLTTKSLNECIDRVDEFFVSIYQDKKIASKKTKTFKKNFTVSMKQLISKWNNEAKKYMPNGRLRKDHLKEAV
jgi:hypothetical protein